SLPTGYPKHRNLTHVFPSLAASLGANLQNTLRLPEARSAILLLIDGLGLEQLEQYAAHAPFLRGKMKQQTTSQTEMSSVYPSTTAVSLSSLGTCIGTSYIGLIGYDVYDPQR